MKENPEIGRENKSEEHTGELVRLRHQLAEFLRANKESLAKEVDKVVESSVPGYESLPPDVTADVRQSFRDFLQLYIDYFDADDFPVKFIKGLAGEVGSRRAAMGLPLDAVISGFDAGETYVWETLTGELFLDGQSPGAWIDLGKMRDRFTRLVRHYLRKAYDTEEKSSISRQLQEFRALSSLGQTIVSTVDIEKILGHILDVATSLMQARMGSIMLLDSTREYFKPVAELGLSRSWVQREMIPVNQSLSGIAIHRSEYVLAKDDELSGFELPRAGVGRKIRSALSIPITVDNEAIGVIELYDTNPRGYTDLDITMLITFGAQAGVAIKNARLFREERKLRRQAMILTEVAQAVSEARDIDELLETIAEKTAVALSVDRCSLFSYDQEANALTFISGYGRSTLQIWLLNQFHIPLGELGNATTRAIRDREPVLVEKVEEDLSLESRIFRGPGVHSYLQVPLVVKDELIGLMSLELTKSEVRFHEDDIVLANSLARQAAVAIQNMRLQERLFEQQLAIRNAEINERLYRERERSEAVLKATPEAVFLIDKDMRVVLENPSAEFLTGWSIEETQGRSCHEVLYGSQVVEGRCPWPDCPINKVLAGDNVSYSEDTLISRSGRQIPGGGTFAPIYGMDGKVENVVAIYRDISEQRELESYARVQREMEIASRVQSSLLPRERLLAGGVSVHARLQPARMVGGDWFDYWSYGDKVFLVIGDASGSGLGAALFATMAMSALRVEAREHETVTEMLEHVNQSLFLSNQTESFVTVFLGVVDLQTMTLSYTNAGHEDPLCVGAENKTPEALRSVQRSLLGIFSMANLDVGLRRLNSGERLVMFTDGVIDAQNPRGKFFGLGRLNRFVAANRDLHAEEFISSLIENVLDFCNGELRDDVTVMVCDIP